MGLCSYNILKTTGYKDENSVVAAGVRGRGETLLYLVVGDGGYTSLHVWQSQNYSHILPMSVSGFDIIIKEEASARGNWMKDTQDFSILPLQLPTNLQRLQSKVLKEENTRPKEFYRQVGIIFHNCCRTRKWSLPAHFSEVSIIVGYENPTRTREERQKPTAHSNADVQRTDIEHGCV